MAKRSIPISVRVSAEDAEFIARLDIAGATTPSDKLRAIIEHARHEHEAGHDYAVLLHQSANQFQPLQLELRRAEQRQGAHSALMAQMFDWLPECIAYLRGACKPEALDNAGALVKLEQGTVVRVLRVLDGFLRQGLTTQCCCYDPGAVRHQLTAVQELAELVVTSIDHKETER